MSYVDKKLSDRKKLDLISMLIPEEFNLPKWAGDIYMIAHPDKDCQHLSWEKETIKLYKYFKKIKML